VPTNKTLYLFQYENGYRYNSDSLVLWDFISKINPKGNLLDIGSGSGVIGLLLKRDFSSLELTQIDIQSLHVELTKKNAIYNKLKSEVLHVNVREASFKKKFDFIVSNPPFYNEGSQKSFNEALKISRYADILPFEELVKSVSKHLKPKGSFVFCYDAKQIDILLSELIKNKFKVNKIRFVHTKQSKDASLVLIHAKKSSKSLCKIPPPLYMCGDEIEDIYKKSATKSKLC